MVESRFKCQTCGRPFDTKSDLKDHEKTCATQAASAPAKAVDAGGGARTAADR